jgi:hypothetical protein
MRLFEALCLAAWSFEHRRRQINMEGLGESASRGGVEWPFMCLLVDRLAMVYRRIW